ncbi:MAG: hypothetical protein AB2L14_11970 [Candidatus Xenobiia bacterium LiM19]
MKAIKFFKFSLVWIFAILCVVLIPSGTHAKQVLKVSNPNGMNLNTLAVTPDGKKLFVLGDFCRGAYGILRIYKDRAWKEYYDHELLRATLAVNAQGDRGWTAAAIGQDVEDHSVIYRFNGTAFEEHSEKMAHTDFTSFAMSDDEKTVVAAGHRYDRKTRKPFGIMMEYREGKWKEININGPSKPGSILSVALDSSGTRGWATGDNGLLIKKEGASWKIIPPPAPFPADCSLRALALSKDGRSGNAVGDNGVILALKDQSWSLIPHKLTKENLTALCMSADGRRRWAFGGNLTMLSWKGSQWQISTVQKPKTFFTRIISACTPWNGSVVYMLSAKEQGQQAIFECDGTVWKELYREKR